MRQYVRQPMPPESYAALMQATIGQNGNLKDAFSPYAKLTIGEFLTALARKVGVDKREGYPEGYEYQGGAV